MGKAPEYISLVVQINVHPLEAIRQLVRLLADHIGGFDLINGTFFQNLFTYKDKGEMHERE